MNKQQIINTLRNEKEILSTEYKNELENKLFEIELNELIDQFNFK